MNLYIWRFDVRLVLVGPYRHALHQPYVEVYLLEKKTETRKRFRSPGQNERTGLSSGRTSHSTCAQGT